MRKALVYIFTFILLFLLGIGMYQTNRRNDEIREYYQRYADEKYMTEKEEYKRASITILDNEALKLPNSLLSAHDILTNNVEGEIILSPTTFIENVYNHSTYFSNRRAYLEIKDLNHKTNIEDILILQFVAYSLENNTELSVSVNGFENQIFLSRNPTSFFIPISGGEEIDSIRFELVSEFVGTVIDSVYLVDYSNKYDISSIATGIYSNNSVSITSFNEEDVILETSLQCLKRDNCIFTISNGTLYAYEETKEGAINLLSSIGGMSNIRDMVFSSDLSAILVSARQSGLYIIDISDVNNLKIISHYDTLEATTGLAVVGEYAFLCSRYFGVEFVDISDLTRPKYVNRVAGNSEYQDCFVSDHYLYIGVYAQKRVDIYDIEELTNPTLVAQINLDGAGQGLFVQDDILYVSTGLNSSNKCDTIMDFGRGTGNGLEIYDVVRPENPKLLSRVKIDGRYWIPTSDVWDIQVSGKYAYLSCMHNGVYIYDITDPTMPVCVEKIELNIDKSSLKYQYYDESRYIANWNQDEICKGSVWHTTVEDGFVYLSSPNYGLVKVEFNGAEKIDYPETNISKIGSNIYDNDESNVFPKYKVEGSVWAVDTDDECIYVACGNEGIHRLDYELNLIEKVDTQYSVRDVKVSNHYLISAESEGGVVIYDISDELKKISQIRFDPDVFLISQITVTNDGNYILAQASTESHILIDICNPYRPSVIENRKDTGVMYFKNIITNNEDSSYVGIYGKRNICIYSMGLERKRTIENTFYSERNGMTMIGNIVIAITDNGYKYIDLIEDTYSELIKIDGVMLKGKCSSDGKTLVICDSCNGNIVILDICDLDNPKLIEKIHIDATPDIPLISENGIFVPCRYGGVLVIKTDNLQNN